MATCESIDRDTRLDARGAEFCMSNILEGSKQIVRSNEALFIGAQDVIQFGVLHNAQRVSTRVCVDQITDTQHTCSKNSSGILIKSIGFLCSNQPSRVPNAYCIINNGMRAKQRSIRQKQNTYTQRKRESTHAHCQQ
jgi:hypothetical protein